MKDQTNDLPPRTADPIGELVFLKLNPPKTRAGLIMPDVVKGRAGKGEQISDEAVTGVVIAAGAQCRYVRRGDTVVLGGSAGFFSHQGQTVHFVKESNLLGIESDERGAIPEHRVTDWREHVVERVGDIEAEAEKWMEAQGPDAG